MTKSNAKFTFDIITHRSSRYNNSILYVKVPHFVR